MQLESVFLESILRGIHYDYFTIQYIFNFRITSAFRKGNMRPLKKYGNYYYGLTTIKHVDAVGLLAGEPVPAWLRITMTSWRGE